MNDKVLIKDMSQKVNELYRDGVSQEGICKILAEMVREHDIQVYKAKQKIMWDDLNSDTTPFA